MALYGAVPMVTAVHRWGGAGCFRDSSCATASFVFYGIPCLTFVGSPFVLTSGTGVKQRGSALGRQCEGDGLRTLHAAILYTIYYNHTMYYMLYVILY